MRVGIVGLSGSGKTTLFDALSGGRAADNVAVIPLDRDEFVDYLVSLENPKKVTHASFTLVDIPGLTTGQHAALAAVRDEVEGLLLVLRGFTTTDYHYRRAEADPGADLADLDAELLLTDLEIVGRRIDKLEVAVTKPTPRQDDEKRELAVLRKVREALEAEVPVRDLELSPGEQKILRGFGLLTRKPRVVMVSLPDEGGEGIPGAEAVRVKLEAELLDLDEEDRGLFMEEMGLDELLLPRLPDEVIFRLGHLRFYTSSEKEVRAWDLPAGSRAVDAAGRIHTDLARGFIRAEVIAVKELREAGGWREAKAAGLVRLEGKDYPVKDGDLIHVRFSV